MLGIQKENERFIARLPVGILFAGLVIALAIPLAAGWENNIFRWGPNDTQLLFLWGGAVAGLFAGGYRGGPIAKERLVQLLNKKVSVDQLNDTVLEETEWKEGQFLSAFSVFVALFLSGYSFLLTPTSGAVPQGGEGQNPLALPAGQLVSSLHGVHVTWFVVVISAAMMATFAYFAARYTLYVKLLAYLDRALSPSHKMDDECRGFMRACLRREEALFEPAGNVFVTVGIAATFIGLAVSLGTLDVDGVLGNANSHGQAVHAEMSLGGQSADPRAAHRPEPDNSIAEHNERVKDRVVAMANAQDAVSTLVRSMSIALAGSMLGVLTAIAAQWLRGNSAAPPLDELIRRLAPAPAMPAE